MLIIFDKFETEKNIVPTDVLLERARKTPGASMTRPQAEEPWSFHPYKRVMKTKEITANKKIMQLEA